MDPNAAAGYHHQNQMLQNPQQMPAQAQAQHPSNPQMYFNPNNPQQMHMYPNAAVPYSQSRSPSAPFQQQQHLAQQQYQQPFPVAGGGLMPAGYPQQGMGPQMNYSTAMPYGQPIPATLGQMSQPQPTSTSNLSMAVAQALPQNTANVPASNMMSAQQRILFQQQQQMQQQQQQQQAQMQAPPPQQQQQQPPQQQQQGQSPNSPQVATREKARVSTLLDINSILLQEVVNLQAAGKAGGTPAQAGNQDASAPSSPMAPSDAAKNTSNKPTPEYIECMRRLQANLAYLASIANKKSGTAAPPAPAILTPPPNMASVNELYAKLNELFPSASRAAAIGAAQIKAGQQALQGNGQAASPAIAPESGA